MRYVYERSINRVLRSRLEEPRAHIQFLSGPRQVGKTTSIRQVLSSLDLPSHYASADGPQIESLVWLAAQWDIARASVDREGLCILALDEIQKIPGWAEEVKRLWDEDGWAGRDLRVVVSGSAPWLMGRGMGESLTGRFETIRATHWTFDECRDAFGWDIDRFILFGGYPGGAPFVEDEDRWKAYVRDSIIETTLSRDVLHLARVDKPALLRRLLYLACEYSGRELSLRKMMGQLQDAGNATTLAHYLDLLEGAGMVSGLQKYAGETVRRRASSPKLQVHDTALMWALSSSSAAEDRRDGESWGRLVESAVGAYLIAVTQRSGGRLYYWRAGGDEVDFVFERGSRLILIEVKSGSSSASTRGFAAFEKSFGVSAKKLIVGTGGVPLDKFLAGEVGF